MTSTLQLLPDHSDGDPLPGPIIKPVAFKDKGSVMAEIFVVFGPPTGPSHERYLAYECLLQYCVQTYNASEVKGVLIEIAMTMTLIHGLMARHKTRKMWLKSRRDCMRGFREAVKE